MISDLEQFLNKRKCLYYNTLEAQWNRTIIPSPPKALLIKDFSSCLEHL